jgi:DNA uptake protein ComE-like DNA-binding protein
MNFFRSHFWYNKSQRNGILILITIILIFQAIYIFVDFSNDEVNFKELELSKYQDHIDSLKVIQKEKNKSEIYPFNPNYITDFKGYQLGMSVDEIDNLINFRKTGQFVNSAAEFQKVTKVSDSLLKQISPYFKFPEWVSKSESTKIGIRERKAEIVVKDLNSATENNLIEINGIGEKLAKRIIAYRKLLGGFTFDDQLYEVYYLDSVVADKVLISFKVIEKPIIDKININEASFKEILHLPYIDYNLTKKILNYRDDIKEFKNMEELKKIDSFPLDKFNRIALYLTAE